VALRSTACRIILAETWYFENGTVIFHLYGKKVLAKKPKYNKCEKKSDGSAPRRLGRKGR